MADVVLNECLKKFEEPSNNARRLFHGRGHCFPGWEQVTVDWLPPYLLVAAYRDFDAQLARDLCRQLRAAVPGCEGVALQRRDGRKTVLEPVTGQLPEEFAVYEDGLAYLVQPGRNQNIGLFLDMSEVRRWVRQFVTMRRSAGGEVAVLNLFAYTCAFSVVSVAAGARLVVNNDMSRPALDWGRRNHDLNNHDSRSVRMLPHNLFKSWWKVRQHGPYDLVIVDPPTNQRGSFTAEKNYGQVLKRMPDLLQRGGEMIACLNSPFLGTDFLPNQAGRFCPTLRAAGTLPVSPDFPEQFPDRGLKVERFVKP